MESINHHKTNKGRRETQNRSQNESVDLSSISDSINECVRYILCRMGNKVPIKKSDISKHLQPGCPMTPTQLKALLKHANNKLKQVYGYKLVEVDAGGGNAYIVVLDEECESTMMTPLVDFHHRQLLVAALTHIFMTGGPVRDDDMWNFLTEAGLLQDLANKKLLTTTFTKQLYLTYSKKGEGEQVHYEFDWGQRAAEEVPKMFLLQKMADAFDKTPDHWCEQYKEANPNNEST